MALVVVKIAHTVAWGFFAGCILAIPVVSWWGRHVAAAWLSAIVLAEVVILVANGWRCPLTAVAARFTEPARSICWAWRSRISGGATAEPNHLDAMPPQ